MGRRQITEEISGTNNRVVVQTTSTTTTKKSMTLPARMQPPSEFSEDTNLNHQTQVSVTPTINSNGTGSIGRVENSKKGNIQY